MPRKVNPGNILSGPGTSAPSAGTNKALAGGGAAGHVRPSGNVAPGFPKPPADASAAISHHIDNPAGAHHALAISTDPFALQPSTNVQGALTGLASGVAPPPPMIGQQHRYMPLSGIPDWGGLKLAPFDRPVKADVFGTDVSYVYPLYASKPTPTPDLEFGDGGGDPATDKIWNNLSSDPWGATEGVMMAGAYTLDGDAPQPIVRTRLYPQDMGEGKQLVKFTLSGMVFPADRGVLALIHWPAGGDVADFLSQPLLERCWAALLMGQGIGTPCLTSIEDVHPTDGDPGGIFHVGADGAGRYNPFTYPGQATGQYDLHELHTGVSDVEGSPLPAPWHVGRQRQRDSVIPGAGQVRLGTDPSAGEPPERYGIPILGGDVDAYNPQPPSHIGLGEPAFGHVALPTTEKYNFFRYRLPYLSDYSEQTGLKYTPRAQFSPTGEGETARYFKVASPSNLDEGGVIQSGTDPVKLASAGAYPNFEKDHWAWQVARYRQVFWANDLTGTLWLVHFKKEADFEAFVRDGIMPWDLTDGYDVYGMSLVQMGVEDTGNLVNEDPLKPPYTYGYKASPYHTLRREMRVVPEEVPYAFDELTWGYTLTKPNNPPVMWVSGVAYFTPQTVNGDSAFRISQLDVEVDGFWEDGFRTSDNFLTDTGVTQLSSLNPAMISIDSFAKDGDDIFRHGVWEASGVWSYEPPMGLTDARGKRKGRIEFPFTKLGSNSEGAFSNLNGPKAEDKLSISLGAGFIGLLGDMNTPAFTDDAVPVLHLRRFRDAGYWAEESGSGFRFNGDGTVLFHSAAPDLFFGNFTNGNGLTTLNLMPERDTHERFLDEVYRYDFSADHEFKAALVGPGMNGWGGGAIPVPVRAGADNGSPWNEWSWLQQGKHRDPLPAGEAQVKGLPYRSPHATDWVTERVPSAGILAYPSTDYTSDYHPSNDELAPLGASQPDYSELSGDRAYIRCFDANFSRSDNPIEQQGQPFVYLRIDGLDLDDFAYAAPGLGGLNRSGVAVLIKVPGLTTWMDLGRRDGDGPSKQDIVLDGAGCRVDGPYTYTYVDPQTGLVYSQVQAHVGPAATLAAGLEIGSDLYEAPVLVKVILRETAADRYDLLAPKEEGGLPDPDSGGGGVSTTLVRGIVGIRLLRPEEAKPLTNEMRAAKEALGITVR